MHGVLVQRKQTRPLGGKAKKSDYMDDDDDWEKLDALTMSTIRLHLVEKLYNMYEKETTANKVFLMRKLYDLHMSR